MKLYHTYAALFILAYNHISCHPIFAVCSTYLTVLGAPFCVFGLTLSLMKTELLPLYSAPIYFSSHWVSFSISPFSIIFVPKRQNTDFSVYDCFVFNYWWFCTIFIFFSRPLVLLTFHFIISKNYFRGKNLQYMPTTPSTCETFETLCTNQINAAHGWIKCKYIFYIHFYRLLHFIEQIQHRNISITITTRFSTSLLLLCRLYISQNSENFLDIYMLFFQRINTYHFTLH